jgi:hypothetical protein
MKRRIIIAALGLALPAVARAQTFEGLEQGPDAGETFRRNALGLVSTELTSVSLFSSTESWWRVVRGKFRYKTSYTEFYQRIGRPDLAEQHERRSLVAYTMVWGGLAVMAGGGFLAYSDLRNDGFHTKAKVGVGMLAAGLTSALIGPHFWRPAISEEEAGQLISDYNKKLRLHLGLAPAERALVGPSLSLSLRGSW